MAGRDSKRRHHWLPSILGPQDSAKDKPARGVVVSVGEGKLDDKGNRHPLQVKPGDRVVFTSYAGEAFQVAEQELLLMREDDILAVLG